MKSLVIAGQAGQGVQLVSRLLGRALVRVGYHVFVSQDVMSRIRGGHNFARLRIGSAPVAADADRIDVLVLLDPRLAAEHEAELAEGASVLMNGTGESNERTVSLPLDELARRYGKGSPVANAVAAGGAMAMLGADIDEFCSVLAGHFESRGTAVTLGNVGAARAGYEYVRTAAPRSAAALPRRAGEPERLLVSGAEALALGSIAAGVRVVAGYPMSPGTPVLEYCARHAGEAGLAVEQAEDEIAAVNLALGASYAGARSMVATAGGGFALMNEGLSLAGMTETPLVACVGMRPGPATGMATRTAQADLLAAVSAGHGEFPRAVLAPADAVEAFAVTQAAFRVAEDYQTLAVVLFDQFLGDALWTVERRELSVLPIEGSAEPAGGGPGGYRRYAATDSGVSPRLLPGQTEELVYADSDEHSEAGHITESAEVRRAQVEKRARKTSGIAASVPPPSADVEPGARNIVFTFGSTRGVVREAAARLRARGRSIATAHVPAVWPFPAAAVAEMCARGERVLTAEGNYSAQLAQLIAQECGLRVSGSVRRWDGRQLRVAEVEEGLERLLAEDGDAG